MTGQSNHRHRETQIQLQRKLQEREMLREQKRKLEQQRSEIEADNDSRDSNDASRDSVTMVTATGSTQGKAMAAGSDGGGRARGGSVGGRGDLNKHQPPVTPQKLILPKTMSKISPGSASCPGTPQGSSSKGVPAVSTVSPAANGGTAQQILVFSPTAHSNQLNPQPLLILSPLNQKGGSQQIQQATGAIQTTQQVNIIPPTKEHGVAQLQPVAVSVQQQQQSVTSGSENSQTISQTSASKPANLQGNVVLTTTPALATIPAATVSSSAVFQFVTNTPTSITVPSITNTDTPSKTPTSHVTTTATSQGQVPVQVQHTPTEAKAKIRAGVAHALTGTQTTPSVSSVTKTFSGPILSKENAQSLLSEQFNSRRSLLFDKKTSVSSPSSSSSSDGESSTSKKSVSLPQDSVSVVSQINGTQVLKINDPSQIPKLPPSNSKEGKTAGLGATSIKSPAGSDKDKQGKGNRLISKTVSSLLKEQRGYSVNVDSKAAYVNDRRPVSEILRESRERKLRQLVGSVASMGTPTLSPNTVMIQTVTVSKPSNTNDVETTPAQASPQASAAIPNTIFLKKNSSGMVTSATTQKLTTQDQGSPVHVISIPKSSVSDDIISPNVSLAPKRMLSTETGPRKRFCSGDGHYDILQTQHGTLEVLKTEQSPDGNLKMKLISHPIHSTYGLNNTRGRAKQTASRAPATATATNSNGMQPKSEGRRREISICSDKESFDYVGNELDVDLADINPSITQIMGSNQEDKGKTDRTDDQAASADNGRNTQVINMTSKEFAERVNLAQQQQQSVAMNQQQQRQQQQQQQQQVMQCLLNIASQNATDNRRSMLQTAIAQGQTQGQAVQALAAALANQQLQRAKQQQQQQQLQLQQQQTNLSFLSQQDSGLNLQETSDQISTEVNQQQQQTKSGLSSVQLNELLMGASNELMPELKSDVLLSQAADTFQGRLLRSRSLSGPAQRKPSVGGMTSAEDMARQRSMSTIGFAPNANLNANIINALQQVASSVPQTPHSSTPMQQHSPLVRTGSMSLPNSRRSSFVGSLSSSPVGMMSPGGPNSAHASAASTPISVMSPGMNPAYRSMGASPVEPSNSFMPIQNSYQDVAAAVNLVRPMVTVASVMTQPNISNPQVAQAPLLQGSGSGFVPYLLGTKDQQDFQQQLDLSTDSSTNLLSQQGLNLSINQFNNTDQSAVLSQNQQLQQQQQQQQSINMQNRNPPPAYNVATLQQHTNQVITNPVSLQQRLAVQQKMLADTKEDGKFAPVSSIKPVKRGGKGSKPAASAKRQRHRSAQPAIGRNIGGSVASTVSSTQPRPMASKNALLQALLSGTSPVQPPSLQTSHHTTGKLIQ